MLPTTYDCMGEEVFRRRRREKLQLKITAEKDSHEHDAIDLSQTPKFERRWGRGRGGTNLEKLPKNFSHFFVLFARGGQEREEKNVIKDISYEISEKGAEKSQYQ
jgi:hypothetical protein